MSDYTIWVCLSCGGQSRGPAGHSVAGDDACCACPVAEGQPRLARVAVRVIDDGTSSHLWRARAAAKRAQEERAAKRGEGRVES